MVYRFDCCRGEIGVAQYHRPIRKPQTKHRMNTQPQRRVVMPAGKFPKGLQRQQVIAGVNGSYIIAK